MDFPLKNNVEEINTDESRKIRFNVLSRDDFTCQLCGSKAPNIEIVVSEIIPSNTNLKLDEGNLI